MLPRLIAVALLVIAGTATATAQSCGGRKGVLGVARNVEIDTRGGPIYGEITKAAKETSFLGPKEVVLTFDDGPMPCITSSILDTLDQFCTKATFFSVGQMAIAYPETTKTVLHRGHTLGTHTWSHPLNIARLKPDQSIAEIERGFAAVAMAAGQPIAPFFRFPGLSDSSVLLDHLQKRGIASFTVDVVSNDSFIGDPRRLAQTTLQRIEQRQGGIVLFHDIKASTAKALPVILGELVQRGYRVVHLTAAKPVVPVTAYDAELGAKLAKVEVAAGAKRPLVPFFGAADTMRLKPGDDAPVTRLSADAKPRVVASLVGPAARTAAQASGLLRRTLAPDAGPVVAKRPRRATRVSEDQR